MIRNDLNTSKVMAMLNGFTADLHVIAVNLERGIHEAKHDYDSMVTEIQKINFMHDFISFENEELEICFKEFFEIQRTIENMLYRIWKGKQAV